MTATEKRLPRRAIAAILDTPWAITPDGLRQVLQVAAREGEDLTALATRLGRPLERTQAIDMRGPVAVARIDGPIFRYANMMTDLSGAVSLEVLAKDLQAAVDDDKVGAILLAFDSPGGEVTGIADLSAQIREWSKAKPIVAHVDGNAASAGYWLAVGAPEIAVSETGRVGSIGVVATYRDDRERKQRAGVTDIEIVSSGAPNKRPDPSTDEGRAQVRGMLDALEARFVDAVAAGRGVAAATVRSDFGQGGMLVGSDAVAAGMADRVASFEEVLAGLVARLDRSSGSAGRVRGPGAVSPRPYQTEVAMSDTPKPTADDGATVSIAAISASWLKATLPEVAGELVGEGRAKAGGEADAMLAEERARVAAIDAATVPGHEELAAKAKAEGTGAGAFALEQAAAIKAAGGRHLKALEADETALDAPPAARAAATADKTKGLDPNSDAFQAAVQAEWDGDAAIQAEFSNFSTYAAFRRSEARKAA